MYKINNSTFSFLTTSSQFTYTYCWKESLFYIHTNLFHYGHTEKTKEMSILWKNVESLSCTERKSSEGFFFFPFPAISLFFFLLGQSCCGPWCRVPRARRWNSNMDHLTPVKTALLVERQALSAHRGKCYAGSQFPSFPLNLSPVPLILLLNIPTFTPKTLVEIPSFLIPIFPFGKTSQFSNFLVSSSFSDYWFAWDKSEWPWHKLWFVQICSCD